MDELLSALTVGDYLRDRGVIDSSPDRVEELSGGVSNVVLGVRASGRNLVIKQSLERLRVAEEWLAPRDRILAEAAALQVVEGLMDDAAPSVIDIDPVRMTLTMERAGEGWSDWKSQLLSGRIDATVASQLGLLLATVHHGTRDAQLPREIPADKGSFEILRLQPYHATVAERVPEVASAVKDVIERLRSRSECLVHGDFSPKNILVGPSGRAWMIDFEVAHRGDPLFDVAFLLTHLWMKAIHHPTDAARFWDASQVFLRRYSAQLHPHGVDDRDLLAQVGCLLLARVHGKSPADYLTARDRGEVDQLGKAILMGRIRTTADVGESQQWRTP